MYRVLIVDDDVAILYMLKRFNKWEECGFSINGEASDGKEALQKLQDEQYDLIITDIKMPGMDGIEFLQELRSLDIDTCVIFLSTHSDFEYAKQGIRFGVFEYITKPLMDSALLEILVRAQAYIGQKYEQKANLNIRESLQQEKNLRVYYPNNNESSIIKLILSGDSQLENVTVDTFKEICTMQSGDAEKVRVLANSLLFNIRSKVDETFPWLNKVEGNSTYPSIRENEGIEVMLQEFLQNVLEMQEKIQKYELNHADSIIRRICECVIDNIENEISLELISNEVHISRDYVGKIFKQKVMCNFNDYVTKIKMEHAKYLLLLGDYKNYEVSEKLGYKKTDYFASLFKAYTGFTPMEYKKLRTE
ncbi:MAG: response regulator transcription factor [Ruminiclostridium sp.]